MAYSYRYKFPALFFLSVVMAFGQATSGGIFGSVSLVRGFPIREKLQLQLRVEMHNALNHTQFSSLNQTALFNAAGAQTNAQFGQFTTARNPRIMQWALRLRF